MNTSLEIIYIIEETEKAYKVICPFTRALDTHPFWIPKSKCLNFEMQPMEYWPKEGYKKAECSISKDFFFFFFDETFKAYPNRFPNMRSIEFHL